MQQLRQLVMAIAILLGASFALDASAQQLWKYVDKDGKVTYSDKPPKNGEKAEAVSGNAGVNVMDAPRNRGSAPAGPQNAMGKPASREQQRESLRTAVDQARGELDAAKKALEEGRNPLPEEQSIVVGRDKKGRPTGANTVNRSPEYDTRISGLEEAVKKAEAKVETAEQNLRRNAPN